MELANWTNELIKLTIVLNRIATFFLHKQKYRIHTNINAYLRDNWKPIAFIYTLLLLNFHFSIKMHYAFYTVYYKALFRVYFRHSYFYFDIEIVYALDNLIDKQYEKDFMIELL